MRVPVTQTEFDKLVRNLQPGTFLIVATSDAVTLHSRYVDYVWAIQEAT